MAVVALCAALGFSIACWGLCWVIGAPSGGFPETVANAAVCNRQLNAAVCIFDTMSDEAGLGGRTQSPFVSVAFCRSHFFRPCDVGSFLFPSISLRSTKKWKPGKCDT